MSRDKRGRGFTTGRRRVPVAIDQRCSIEGCDALAEGSVTIASPAGEVRYYGCVEHVGPLRAALAAAMRQIDER